MRKSISAFILVIGLLMTLFVAARNQLVPTAHAHSGTVLSAWAKTMPKIDGYREPRRSGRLPNGLPFTMSGEYDDAYKVDFTLTYGSDIHPSTLWVKNDYVNLYVAVEIRNEEFNSIDSLFVNFDNDHDGVKETGDDILYLSGGGSQFIDEYYNAGGSNVKDTLDGGTRDGAGAAGYKTSTSTWVFEMVHPLNTGDDAHDFSLSIGSTVGVNLFYWDGAGGVTGWPAFTSDWTQMADIVIAGPPTPPPSSSVDLTITGIEVTQAVQTIDNSLPLVQGKNTVVRVYVGIGPVSASSVTVWIHLYGVDGNGKSLSVLSRGLEAPKTPDRSKSDHTANILLPKSWVNSATLVLKAFVKAYSTTQSETNYNNNWMAEKTLTLKATTVPTIYIVPINTGTSSSPILPSDAMIAEQENYFKTIYPVSDVNFVLRPWTDIGTIQGLAKAIAEVRKLGYQLGLTSGGIDQIFGFTSGMGGATSDPLWALGGSGSGFAAAGDWGTSQEGTMAHEIDHNWGPGTASGPPPDYAASPGWGRHIGGTSPPPASRTVDEGDLDWPYRLWPEATRYMTHEIGFDTLRWLVVPDTTSDLMSYNVTVGTYRDFGDPFAGHSKWISAYRWQKVFDFLDPPAEGAVMGSIQQVGESFMISGWIGQNGTGSLDPIFRIPGEQESPSIVGNYSIVLKNNIGTTLLTHWFTPQFIDVDNQTQDPAYFTILLPNIANTTRVLLKSGATVLDEISMTSHSPQVTVLSPNGGEIWNATGLRTISWTAYDLDNDTLTYRLYYSPDNGTTWTPISPALGQLSYQVDASYLKAGNQSRIKVVATDGFNKGEDLSNMVFRVHNHPPTADIILPPDGSKPNMLAGPWELLGKGADPDEALPESAFSWSSDVEGFIGYGSSLTWQPTQIGTDGKIRITLTVTDSSGRTATDTVTITPIFDVTMGGTVPGGLIYNQTAVGQGYTAKIRLQVNNQGPLTLSFNVTASANGNPFQSIPILNLPGGNSTYLELLWNTTGKPKGIYNITTTVTLPEYEIIQLLDTIRISIVGDITGSAPRVPDGKVDIKDLATMAKVYGVLYPDIRYDPNCDLTGSVIGVPDGKIDIKDLATAAKNYGKIDP